MKRVFRYFILFVFVFVLSNCDKKTQNLLYDSKFKEEIIEVRKEASMYIVLNNIPGATFAISKKGKIIYSEGMGLASKDLEVPVTRKTKFRIGDVSELFTSLVYQIMIEDGLLHPDSTVKHYIPDYPASVYKDSKYDLALAQLANHTSGIKEVDEMELMRGGGNTLLKSIDNFKNDPLIDEPDWFQNASVNNYNLLGAVMEKASGKSFPELLKEYITDTLNLTNTDVDNPFRTVIGRTDFFDYNLVYQVVKATFRDMRNRIPSEGILSNAEDLVKFGNALLYSDIISNSVKERLFELPKLKGDFPATIANSWIVKEDVRGELFYGKVGEVTGGGAILLIVPDKELVIAGVVNLTTNSEIPVFKMLQPFIEETEKDTE